MKNQRGITLIALVITIIVLIILAGVAINLTLGENGILRRAQDAQKLSDKATVKEKIEVAIVEVQVEEVTSTGSLTLQKLYETLESKDSNITLNEYTQGDTELTGTYNLNGKIYNFTIDSQFNVIIGDGEGDGAPDEEQPEKEPVQIGEIVWNEDGTVSVEVSTELTGNIEYQVNGTDGEWQTGSLPTNLQHGDKLYVRVNDGTTTTEPQEIEIKDTIKPEEFTISVPEDSITYEALRISSIGTTDNQTGLKDYSFVVTKDGEIVQEIKNQTVTEYTIEELSPETQYVVYMLAYDNAGNARKSNEVTVTTPAMPVARMFGQYVDYPVDIDDNPDDYDWMIFYIEDGENNPDYEGATYIIPDYYVPASKMPNTLKTDTSENSGMIKHSKGTYRVKWSSAPSYKEILDGTDSTKPNVKSIFMYDYTDNATTRNYSSVKAVSRLLDITAWESDFVTPALKEKGGLAIGGPTINMWCASWNKAYPTKTIIPTISGVGYKVNSSDRTSLTTDYIPNVCQPIVTKPSDSTARYWIASPSSYNNTAILTVSNGYIDYTSCTYDIIGLRPVVYLPKEVTLTQDATTANLWNINY